MALLSMTGYGRGEAAASGVKVEVDISSVNRKQFDLRVNLPKGLAMLEPRIHEAVHAAVSRGSVMAAVRVNMSEGARSRCIRIDADAAVAYVAGLRKLAKKLKLKDDLGARSLVNLPEVVKYEAAPEDPEVAWELVGRALTHAVDQLMQMKKREGMALGRELGRRFGVLKEILEEIRALAPRVPERYRALLQERIASAGVSLAPDDASLLREVALFADRCDISEEIARLDSHFSQGAKLLAAKEPVGRTLDFLCQEMFREINTTGSKANHADITGHVIRFKTDLECIREQVQNVE
jgi:uncharacterized protein (TIGR00255 family)